MIIRKILKIRTRSAVLSIRSSLSVREFFAALNFSCQSRYSSCVRSRCARHRVLKPCSANCLMWSSVSLWCDSKWPLASSLLRMMLSAPLMYSLILDDWTRCVLAECVSTIFSSTRTLMRFLALVNAIIWMIRMESMMR